MHKERPLSFPSSLDSFPESSTCPTSPVETSCCRCKRSKSVGALSPPNGGASRAHKSPQQHRRRFPKFSWSVFKTRHGNDRTVGLRGPGSSQHLHEDSKPTSWTFVQKDARSSPKRGEELPSLASKQLFVITPVSTPVMKPAKRNLGIDRRPSAPVSPARPRVAIDRRPSAPVSLRKYVLNKETHLVESPPVKKSEYVRSVSFTAGRC